MSQENQEQQEQQQEFIYDWDSLVIQLENGGNAHGAIRIMKQDMENMKFLHGMERGEVLDMLVKALETTPNPQEEVEK